VTPQSGTPVELVTDTERAWLAMIRRVQSGKNDLIMVGRRNTPGSTALGSTSRKLMHKCPCPVWVVKPDSELLHDSVLSATDLTPVGDAAVQLGGSIAKAYGCEFHVVHAWQRTLEMQFEAERYTEEELAAQCTEIDEAARKHILDACHAFDPELVSFLRRDPGR